MGTVLFHTSTGTEHKRKRRFQVKMSSSSLWWLLAVLGYAYALIEIPEDYLSAIRQDQAQDIAAGEYNYDQQGYDWTGTCATGSRQSPIDLVSDEVTTASIPRISFRNYDQTLRSPLVLMNNGHSANIVIPVTRGGQRPSIKGGLLPGSFELQSVHFHWGSSTSKGSEHTVNSKRYDVEMHMVHKNIRYPDMDQATRNWDGLAVLGVFIQGAPRMFSRYSGLNRIFNNLIHITQYNTNVTLPGQFRASQLLGDVATGAFYSYNGSLTTPDCAEAVTWTVFSDVLKYPNYQIERFYNLKDSRSVPLINNYREIKDKKERTVYYRESKMFEKFFQFK